MREERLHKHPIVKRTAAVALAIVVMHCEALASGDLSGRFYLTYQDSRGRANRFERFDTHFETTLRDNVWGNNRLALTFFFDNSNDVQNDLTIRRYRGQINLANPVYTIDARLTPRQKTTPLELEQSLELSDHQLSFSLHAPKIPQVRLVFTERANYAFGDVSTRSRDWRADLSHRHKWLSFRLNRWDNRSGKDFERQVDVTGGVVRIDPRLSRGVTLSSSYEVQLTNNQIGIATTDVTNQQVTALLNARHRNLVHGVLSGSTRRLNAEGFRPSRTRNDNALARVALFPTAPATFVASRTYQLTDASTSYRRLDYGAVEMLLRGNIHASTTGRLHLATRWDIDSENSVIPPHSAFGAVRSQLYPGIDMRLELNLSKRKEQVLVLEPYQMTSTLEFYLKPTRSFMLTPSLQTIGSGATIGSIDGDRYTLGLRANYMGSGQASLSADLKRSRTRTTLPRTDTSAVANLSLRLRGRSSVVASYGVTRNRYDVAPASFLSRESNVRTFNINGQVWLSQRGSFSANYTNVDRDLMGTASNLSLSYRLDF